MDDTIHIALNAMQDLIRSSVPSIPEYRAGLEESYRRYEWEITYKNGDFYASAHKFYRCLPSNERDDLLFAIGSLFSIQTRDFSKARAALYDRIRKHEADYSTAGEKNLKKVSLGVWKQVHQEITPRNYEAFLEAVEEAVSTGQLDPEKRAGSLAFMGYLGAVGCVKELPITPDALVQTLSFFEQNSSAQWQSECKTIQCCIQDYDGIWESFGLTMMMCHGVPAELLQLQVCSAGMWSAVHEKYHPPWWNAIAKPVLDMRGTLASVNSCEIYAASLNKIADSLAAKHSEKIEAFAEALEKVPPEKRLATIFLTSFKIGMELGVPIHKAPEPVR